MKIPEKIPMSASMFGDGKDGAAWQQHRNAEYGIQCDAIRKSRSAPFIEAWSSDHLPDREFKRFADLRAALENIEPVPFIPVVIAVEPKSAGSQGKCYTCRAEWTQTVIAKTGWRPTDLLHASSCDGCLDATKRDPIAARDARVKWVREHPINLSPLPDKSIDDDCPF